MHELKSVLLKIRPNEASERREWKFANEIISKLKKQFKGGKVVLAGSFAKGTFLEGDKDIDVFVLFGHGVAKEAMLPIIKAAAENAFPVADMKIAYAQHPYLRLFIEGRRVDIVPAYEVGHGRHFELKTPVDRSQLHTTYILSKMKKAQKDEVRLLKKFLKSNLLYGAEIRVQGFSGYLCELLILKYHTFAGAMKAIALWKGRTFVDIEHGILPQAGLAKFESQLVVLDPVDQERNVAAVVSAHSYFSLVILARKFLESGNRKKFFQIRHFSEIALKKFAFGRALYCVSFRCDEVVDDVLWGQVRRFSSSIRETFKKEGFEIVGWEMGKSGAEIQVVLELLNSGACENKLVLGPPIDFSSDAGKFSNKYPGSFIHEGRIAAVVLRQARTPEKVLEKIKALPCPSHLHASNARLYKGAELIRKCGETLGRYASLRLIV